MGHVLPCAGNLNRTPLPPFSPGVLGGPNVGSTGSFGVDLDTFGLIAGLDSTRLADAATAVVERP